MNKDKRANRYSLKIVDKDKKSTTVLITHNGKTMEKMPLSKIDAMTSYYKNEDELIKSLIELGYPFGNLFIEYKANGQIKHLDVIYSDIKEVAEEASFRENEIFKGNEEPKTSENVILLCYKLIEIERHNKELWRYLQNKNSIWTNITLAVSTHNYLEDIKASEEDITSYQCEILKIIGDYRKFRDIYTGIYNFYRLDNKKVCKVEKKKVIKNKEVI